MKKKRGGVGLLAALCLALSLVPSVAFANDDADVLQEKLNNAGSGGTVKLDRNYTIDTTLNVTGKVALDLDGWVLRYQNPSAKGSVIKVSGAGDLTLKDSNTGNRTHYFTAVEGSNLWTWYGDDGSPTENVVAGGVITGGTGTEVDGKVYGGGIYVEEGGKLAMFSGRIVGNEATSSSNSNPYGFGGGGVCVGKGATFTMSGGEISHCRTSSAGGAVDVESARFEMQDGVISDCYAVSGGGVGLWTPYIEEGRGVFAMSGGTIAGCESVIDGNSVSVAAGDFAMSGGLITRGVGGIAGKYGVVFMVTLASSAKSVMYADGGTVDVPVLLHTDSWGRVTLSRSVGARGMTSFMKSVGVGGGSVSAGIYYDSFSGPVSGKTITFMNGETQFAKEIVGEGEKAVRPKDPEKEGFRLASWCQLQEDGSLVPWNFDSDTVSDDLTLYAQWETKTYSVTYEYDGQTETDVKTHDVDLTLRGATFAREGFVQTGWVSADGERQYELGEALSANEDVTLNPVWGEIVTLKVPYATTVKLGGDLASDATTFDLEIVSAGMDDSSWPDVTVSASVTVTGAANYLTDMAIMGPSKQLRSLFCEGAFVQQVNAGAKGWTYDDTVWALVLEDGAVAASPRDDGEIAPGEALSVLIFPTKTEDKQLVVDYGAGPAEHMAFTNVYTANSPVTGGADTEGGSNGDGTGGSADALPSTGDSAPVALLALLAVSGVAAVGAGVRGRKQARAE